MLNSAMSIRNKKTKNEGVLKWKSNSLKYIVWLRHWHRTRKSHMKNRRQLKYKILNWFRAGTFGCTKLSLFDKRTTKQNCWKMDGTIFDKNAFFYQLHVHVQLYTLQNRCIWGYQYFPSHNFSRLAREARAANQVYVSIHTKKLYSEELQTQHWILLSHELKRKTQ